MGAPLRRSGDSHGDYHRLGDKSPFKDEIEPIEPRQPPTDEKQSKLTGAAKEQISKTIQDAEGYHSKAKTARSMISRDVKELHNLEVKLGKTSNTPKNAKKIEELKTAIADKKFTIEIRLKAARELLEKQTAHPKYSDSDMTHIRKGVQLAAETTEVPAKYIQQQLKALKGFFRALFGISYGKADQPKLRQLAAALDEYNKRYEGSMHKGAALKAAVDLGKACWQACNREKRFPQDMNLYLNKMDEVIARDKARRGEVSKEDLVVHKPALKCMVLYLKHTYPEEFAQAMKDGQFQHLDKVLLDEKIITKSFICQEHTSKEHTPKHQETLNVSGQWDEMPPGLPEGEYPIEAPDDDQIIK